MKKLLVVLGTLVSLSACASGLQASVVFDEVWDDVVDEWFWDRQEAMDLDEARLEFAEWSDNYERKRAKLVRVNEDGKVQGSTVIMGENIARNIEQMEIALKKSQKIEVLQDDNKDLLKKVCEVQKPRVGCGL